MPDLEFNFRPSKQYLLIISLILLTSMVIVLALMLGVWIKLLIFILIMGYGGHIFWKYGLLQSRHSITGIRRHSDGRWHLYTQDNTYHADIRGDSTVTSLVSVLRFRVDRKSLPVSCIVFRDSLPPDFYRQLIVLLKMH